MVALPSNAGSGFATDEGARLKLRLGQILGNFADYKWHSLAIIAIPFSRMFVRHFEQSYWVQRKL